MWINKDKIVYAQIKKLYEKPLSKKEESIIREYYIDAVVNITDKGAISRDIFSAKTEEECKQFLNKLGLIENKL